MQKHCREKTSASRGQDHTTSPSAKGAVRLSVPPRPSQPALNVRDDREAPLIGSAGRPRLVEVICPTAQEKSLGTGAAPLWPIGTTGKSVHIVASESQEKKDAAAPTRSANRGCFRGVIRTSAQRGPVRTRGDPKKGHARNHFVLFRGATW